MWSASRNRMLSKADTADFYTAIYLLAVVRKMYDLLQGGFNDPRALSHPGES